MNKVKKRKLTKESCRSVFYVKEANGDYVCSVKIDLQTGRPCLEIINWIDKKRND